MTFKNPNRAFTLDSIYQEQLRDEGIIARTAVCFSQGDSLAGCSNEAVCRRGIALYPVVFGPKHDAKRIELQAYVLFSSSYLISRMPLIWGLILLWVHYCFNVYMDGAKRWIIRNVKLHPYR